LLARRRERVNAPAEAVMVRVFTEIAGQYRRSLEVRGASQRGRAGSTG
jgi:hypothetical protein